MKYSHNIFKNQNLLRQNFDDLQIEFDLINFNQANSVELQDIDQRLASLQEHVCVLDEEINQLTNHADGFDYAIAAASGILTGLIDSFFVGEINWATEKGEIHKKFNQFIEQKAKREGYNGDGGLKGAIAFLEKKYPIASDNIWSGQHFSSTKSHHLDDVAHHPTLLGLTANFITTLFRVGIFNDKNGEWHLTLTDSDFKELFKLWSPLILTAFLHWLVTITEQKYTEKQQQELPKPIRTLVRTLSYTPAVLQIFKIADIWFGHLVSDMGGSKNTAGGGMGIPGIFLSFLKELSSIPPFSMTKLPQMVNTWYVKDKFDMRTEATVLNIAGKQAIPVLLNEIFVRGFYFIRRLINEAEKHGTNWDNYEWQKTLPFNNRTIVRMLSISHGTFVAFDMADAAIRTAISGQYVDVATFLSKMALRVNFVGIGRFTIAIATDLYMGFKRNIKIHERMYLHSQMLHLYEAKIFYIQENMWIEAKKSEIATLEMYETVQKAVLFFSQAMQNIKNSVNSFDAGKIKIHNPGLSEELINMLKN